MRILMLDNEFPPLGGGTGVVNYHLLRELATFPQISVDLVTSSRMRSAYETEQFAEHITIYKVPVDNQNIHHSSNAELLRYVMRGLRFCYTLLSRNRYDISFAYAGVPAGAMSYILKKTRGLPYFLSLQGPDVPGFEARYNYLYPFLRPLLRRVWREAGVVTAISKQHRDLAHQTLADLQIPIIYNGVETDVFYPSQAPADLLKIVCVGRLIERKGQHYLLRAFAALRSRMPDAPLQLQLVGTGDAEAELKQLAEILGIAADVDFTGFVARADMPLIYHQAHVFALPSQSEGMSIALLEAMASGLPVVVTDTGGTDELVIDGKNGLVVQWADVEGLTAALAQLVADASLRAQMGATCRKAALRLSWREITEQHVRLLEDVIERSTSSHRRSSSQNKAHCPQDHVTNR